MKTKAGPQGMRKEEEEEGSVCVQLPALPTRSRRRTCKPCICGMSERTGSVSTTETSQALAAVDFGGRYTWEWAYPVAQMIKNLPAMQETAV